MHFCGVESDRPLGTVRAVSTHHRVNARYHLVATLPGLHRRARCQGGGMVQDRSHALHQQPVRRCCPPTIAAGNAVESGLESTARWRSDPNRTLGFALATPHAIEDHATPSRSRTTQRERPTTGSCLGGSVARSQSENRRQQDHNRVNLWQTISGRPRRCRCS